MNVPHVWIVTDVNVGARGSVVTHHRIGGHLVILLQKQHEQHHFHRIERFHRGFRGIVRFRSVLSAFHIVPLARVHRVPGLVSRLGSKSCSVGRLLDTLANLSSSEGVPGTPYSKLGNNAKKRDG